MRQTVCSMPYTGQVASNGHVSPHGSTNLDHRLGRRVASCHTLGVRGHSALVPVCKCHCTPEALESRVLAHMEGPQGFCYTAPRGHGALPMGMGWPLLLHFEAGGVSGTPCATLGALLPRCAHGAAFGHMQPLGTHRDPLGKRYPSVAMPRCCGYASSSLLVMRVR